MEKLRAVIYNRCSTEEESQKDALIKQVQESKNCIAEQGWALVDAYVEAKSGYYRYQESGQTHAQHQGLVSVP